MSGEEVWGTLVATGTQSLDKLHEGQLRALQLDEQLAQDVDQLCRKIQRDCDACVDAYCNDNLQIKEFVDKLDDASNHHLKRLAVEWNVIQERHEKLKTLDALVSLSLRNTLLVTLLMVQRLLL